MSAGKPKPKTTANTQEQQGAESASQLIDQRIQELADWRGETLARVRKLILEADPEITEEWKWSNPVWSHHGIICTGESYKKVVKLTFAEGAKVPDPAGLFNSSLEGNKRRAIDIQEGEQLDAKAFKTLIKAAIALNKAPADKKAKPTKSAAKSVKLLSGGNPQIAKADGDAPVQTYIEGMPGWKRDIGRWLDDIIVRTVPNVRKAVKWNSPFYGIEGQGWFVNIHCLTKYVKVTFFQGKLLQPPPTGCTPKTTDARWLDIYENDPLDEEQMTNWVKQAAELPGWIP